MNASRSPIKTLFVLPSFAFLVVVILSANTVYAQEEKLQLEIMNGHSGGDALCVAVSTDAKFALTGSTDNTALLWDLATGKQIRRFVGHDDAVSAVQFSKDGLLVLTAGHDGSAFLWETATGRRVRGFKENVGGVLVGHFGKILSAAISPDGRFVATGGEDKTARLWDAKTGHQLFEIRHGGQVNSIAFSPDSTLLLTGGEDKIARVFSTETGKRIGEFSGHTGDITKVAYSPDGQQILTGSTDQTIRLWSVESHAELKNFSVGATIKIVGFTEKGRKYFIAASENRSDELWDLMTEKPARKINLPSIWAPVTRVESLLRKLNREKHLPIPQTTATDERSLIWIGESSLGSVVWGDDLRIERTDYLQGRSGTVDQITITPDRDSIVVSTDSVTGGVWNLGNQGYEQTFQRRYSSRISYSQDGSKYVALTDDLQEIYLHDLLTSTSRPIAYKINNFLVIDLSPDGKKLLIGNGEGNAFGKDGNNGDVIVWDVEKDREIKYIKHHKGGINAVSFSPDGTTFATASNDGTVCLWGTSSGRLVKTFDLSLPVRNVVFQPDGREFVVAFGGNVDMRTVGIVNAAKANSVRFFDIETGKEIDSFGGEFKMTANKFSGFKSVTYSPDGKFVAAGAFDGKVWLRDRETREIKKFEGHTDAVNSVKFTKDVNGNLLIVSGSSDSTVRLWNVATGEELCALVSFRDDSWAVVQTKSGRFDTNNVEAIDGLQWVSVEDPLRAIPSDVILRQYFEPDLLRRILKCKANSTANGSDLCDREFKPLPPIGSINRTRPHIKAKKY